MTEISATEAARGLADVLDAVEHRGERFTVIRRGRPVARIEPLARGEGLEVKELLAGARPDAQWAGQLADMRRLLELDART
ncbi:type II toxin-antitoxin system Phd/YefM family antitoxin [Candidatus Poriferisodalis sp.]|uniref:type II toxin-antitoxin system Phd/YefM family antitoxin n=1 Tax=Candidatus Poriferisodalis sp. TaxID=3101277 RepID=UPI003B52C007